MNKKLFLFLLIGLFLASFASAFNWSDKNIETYYKLDNTTGVVYDMLGNNDGTNSGADRGVVGKINTAFDFVRANGDYVDIPRIVDSFPNDNFTINMWAKTDTLSANNWLYSEMASSDCRNIHIRANATDITANIGSGCADITQTQAQYISGEWVMITVTNEISGDLSLYLNGTLMGSSSAVTLHRGEMTNSVLGAYNVGSQNFDGIIDEVGIWNGVLTADEILELYNSGDGLSYNQQPSPIFITLESPANGTTISDIGTNFTVIGSNISSASGTWQNITYYVWDDNNTLLNSTTISTSGETFNETLFIDNFGFETYIWNAEACYTNVTGSYCVSAANNNTLYVSLFTIVNESYVNETVSGTLENFSISIDLLEGYDLLSAEFMYNGSTNSPSIIAESENRFLLISDYQIPIFPTDQDISFYWDLTFTGDISLNSTERTQLVKSVLLDNCSTYTYKLFNISLYDERQKTPIYGDIEMLYSLLNKPAYQQINTFNFSITNITNTEICSGLNLSGESLAYSAEIRYESTGYVPELYHIQRADLTDNPEQLKLFDLNQSQSTEFKVTYQDDNFNFVDGAILQLQRKYIYENIYEVVEAPLTSRDGVAVVHADLDSNKYKATIVKNGEVLDVFDNIVFKCESELTGECELKLLGEVQSQNSIPISQLNDFAYSLAFGNNNITVTFSIPSGSPSAINVVLEHRDMFGNNSVCNKTVTSSAGSIQCTYTDSIGDSYLYLNIYKDDVAQAIKAYFIPEDSGLDFLNNNFIILLVLGSSLVGMAFSSPTWIIVNSVITMVLGGALWLVNGMNFVIGFGGIMWIMIAAGILIFKIAKQEDR